MSYPAYDFSAKKSTTSQYTGFKTEIPTAAKTNYQDFTPAHKQYDTPSLKSPVRYSSKISEARQSLSGLIGDMSAKKSMNE